MLKKLRKRFIIIAMVSVFAVLFLIIASINIFNYVTVVKNADSVIQVLLENNGRFPKREFKPMNMPQKNAAQNGNGFIRGNGRQNNPEIPYETRYFAVMLNENGKTVWTNTGSIISVEEDGASAIASKLFEKNKNSGFYGKFRYKAEEYDGEALYVFVDLTAKLGVASDFLIISAFMSLTALILVFVLIMLLSTRAIKPIAESYEKQKRFITDAGHELKTPLAVISANTEVIELENGENEWTNGIRLQIERMAKLTGDLISLSRMDEEKNDVIKEVFSLSASCERAAEEFSVVAKTKKLAFERELSENIMLSANKNQIEKLLSILLDNAVKYAKTEIKMKLYFEKSRPTLCISNDADSIKEKNLDFFFDRFYRADEARSKQTEGFGLGLSIAKSIVGANGGKISAKSADLKTVAITVIF